MIEVEEASKILAELSQVGRTFRKSGQHSTAQGLTGTKFGLLQYLNRHDTRLTTLALHLSVSAPVASRAVDDLESSGLVERRPDPQDARASLVSITDRGRSELATTRDSAVQEFAEALSDWTPADAAQAIEILKKLNAHLADITRVSGSPSASRPRTSIPHGNEQSA